MYQLTLPYPPSANKNYSFANRVRLSKAVRNYRENVYAVLLEELVKPMTGWLAVTIDLYPPDNHKRDGDNPVKPLFDALQHGGLFADDYQIKKHTVERFDPVPPHGHVIFTITEYTP